MYIQFLLQSDAIYFLSSDWPTLEFLTTSAPPSSTLHVTNMLSLISEMNIE